MIRAVISDCGKYRYLLTRPAPTGPGVSQPCVGTALFAMLNPSTADATVECYLSDTFPEHIVAAGRALLSASKPAVVLTDLDLAGEFSR